MAVPKKRMSRSRTAKRRAQWDVITVPAHGKCNNCGAAARPHRVCGTCGFYRGKQILAVAAPVGGAE